MLCPVQSCVAFIFMVIGCCSANPVPSSPEIHKDMEIEDLRRVFQVESHDEVPHYELVHARSIRKRSIEENAPDEGHQVHIQAFGKTMQLNLRKNKHLLKHSNQLKMFYADTSSSGTVQYKQLSSDENPWIGEVYQDVGNEAALIVDTNPNDGSLMLDGTIGDHLVIKPVPVNIRNEVPSLATPLAPALPPDDEFFLDEEDEDIQDDLISLNGFPLRPEPNDTRQRRRRTRSTEATEGAHIVYKRDVLSSVADTIEMEEDEVPEAPSNSEAHSRQKRTAPNIIYPEILVIVDYDGYRLHNGNNRDVKKYFVSFWNGVDLRYKLLKRPRVKVSIAGIIISRGRDATPYLERNKVGRDAIDSASALTDMGKYLYVERRLPTYDVAVAITKLDMCRRQFGAGICNRGTAGFAYVGGACVVNKRLQKVNSVAIVEDTGGFSGIIVAAHEVGHLLGAVHDGSPPPSYLGGPGARKCRWEDGFIMSDLRHTDKGFKWSQCSIDQFHHFLNGETATCLFNVPHEDDSLPRVLPGKLLSLDAQCRKDRGTSACFKDDRVCAQLFCFDAKSGYCVSYRPAAEGSPCGDSQVCLNGRCIYEHENIIPDYTRITETVERLDTSSSSRWNSWTKGTTPLQKTTTQRTTTTSRASTESPTQSTTRRTAWWKNWFSRTSGPAKLSPSPRKTTTTTSTTVSTTTTTTTTPRTTTTRRPVPSTLKPTTKRAHKPAKLSQKDKEKGVECLDRITNIAGSLTCKEFLRNYGFRYCHHRYIQKNCCASQKVMCNGR